MLLPPRAGDRVKPPCCRGVPASSARSSELSGAAPGSPPMPAAAAARDNPEKCCADRKRERRQQPKRKRLRLKTRLQQHESAIARHQEIDHLTIGVAGSDPLAHQKPADRAQAAHRNRRSTGSGRPCSAIRATSARARDSCAGSRMISSGWTASACDAQAISKATNSEGRIRRRPMLIPPAAGAACCAPALAHRRASGGPTGTARRRRPS